MSKNNTSTVASSGGVGFPSLLTLLFIGLKLTGYIDWTWLWVLSPLWISACVFVVLCIIILIAAVIGAARQMRTR